MAAEPQGALSSSQESVSDIPFTVNVAEVDDLEPERQQQKKGNQMTPRPLMIYTRAQLLLLHESPLVKPPPGMPTLKEWFGVENEQCLSKKETDGSNPGSTRDRRFRREADDSELTSRPAFRSALSQPSQMGNFKHQSMRGNDRDRDRDPEKDRERDKEGQEKLRNLSDKYDRERLALPSTLNSFRNKERETAPHLAGSSSSRSVSQSQFAPVASRRTDNIKKKAGESSEDWRRGEPHRSSRDERLENARKDRDERERPRSRVEDSSGQKRDPSVTKRERDRDNRDRERKGDRDRDDSKKDRQDGRREKEELSRREKDTDKELDLDDRRRWRDDGKRDERMAARRERLEKDREHTHDKPTHEGGHDSVHDRPYDRRWATGEEREGRSKRTSARERRSGAMDENKEKDDRKDREREKEKEPAWMDTYIPSDSSTGILGGKAANGELDGIQAWKKGLKTKEQGSASTKETSTGTSDIDAPEAQLDEIQLFRLMMKREEEKKRAEGKDDEDSRPLVSLRDKDGTSSESMTIREQHNHSNGNADASVSLQATQPSDSLQSVGEIGASAPSNSTIASFTTTSQSHVSVVTASAHSLPSTLTSSSDNCVYSPLESVKVTPSSPDSALDTAKPPTSRLFPKPLPSSDASSSATRVAERLPSTAPSSTNQFNPPPGSRLLAFGARVPSTHGSKSQSSLSFPATGSHIANGAAIAHQNPIHLSSLANFSHSGNPSVQQTTDTPFNNSTPNTELMHAQEAFSPFEDISRPSFAFEETRESKTVAQHSESIRRATELSMFPEGETTITSNTTTFPTGLLHPSSEPFNGLGAYAPSKGSRFAKFFDGKNRETPPTVKSQNPVGLRSSSPGPSQRYDVNSYNDSSGGNGESRTMEDIFAMLNSSTQTHRGSIANGSNTLPIGPQASFGQSNNLPSLQQQIHHHSQLHHPHLSGNRVEPLYDSRIDDRNFISDGLVPGLGSVPPGRNRENNLFVDSSDEFNPSHRIHLQQRSAEQFYSGPLYQQPIVGRNATIPQQQPLYRGGSSPTSSQNAHQNPQRLPHGLAHLGRSPHESSQFLNMPGMSSTMMHANGSSQSFNNFVSPGAGAGYGGAPQMRLVPHNARQLQQNNISHNPMQGLAHPSNVDMRGGQAQLVGMAGPIGGVSRTASSGFGPQQGTSSQMSLLAMRQQQSLPPHMMPHLLPQHLQQQSHPGTNQPAHDLMALLMGGSQRD